jgi:hypothetical protein
MILARVPVRALRVLASAAEARLAALGARDIDGRMVE